MMLDKSSATCELGETTLISTPSPAHAKAIIRTVMTKPNQFAGSTALKNKGAVTPIITVTTRNGGSLRFSKKKVSRNR